MTTSIKKSIVVILSALFVLCMVFVGFSTINAKADASLNEVTLANSKPAELVEIRLNNPTGMRFTTKVYADDLADFDAENTTVVTMITPKAYLEKAGIEIDEFKKESEIRYSTVTYALDELTLGEDGYYTVKAVLLEVQDKNITKEFVAKTYVTDGVNIGYVEAQHASVFEVATYWKEQGLGAEDETTQAILDRYTKCEHPEYVDGACTACGTACEHDWDGAECTICDETREPAVADTTYNVEYIGIANGAVTVDLESINETVLADEITAVVINGTAAEWTVDDNGDLVITTAAYGEDVAVAITVVNAEEYKTVTFKTIFATHIINNEEEWRSYMSQQRQYSYAVITSDITMATEAEVTKGTDPFYVSFTINGLNHSLKNVYDYSGLFGGGISSSTIKNLDISMKNIAGGSIGAQIVGTVTLDNVNWEVRRNGSAGSNIFAGKFYNTNAKLVLKDTTITVKQASEHIQRTDVFINEANAIGTIEMINSTIYCTGTMVKVGETYNGAVWGSKVILDSNSWIEDKYDTVTYADQYVVTNGSVITVDASKINGATVTGVTSAIVGTTTCTASQSGNTISISSSIYGETQLQLVAGNKTYILGDIIVATHVLSDNATFKDFYSKQRNKTYAVVTQNITLEETPEITKPGYYHTGSTVNGLGHTVTNIYCYAGWYSSCLGDGVLKNITVKVKSYMGAMSDELGNFTMDNVTMYITVPGGAVTNYILGKKVLSGRTFTIKNSTINVLMDSALKETPFVLANILDGNINIINSTITSNGTMVMLGETYNSSAWGSEKVTLDATSKMVDIRTAE